jgi:excisionase family DNA binding protein
MGRETGIAWADRRVFCGSLMDIWEARSDLAQPRQRLLNLAYETGHLNWLFLTKRPQNIASCLLAAKHRHHPHNDWWELQGRATRPNWSPVSSSSWGHGRWSMGWGSAWLIGTAATLRSGRSGSGSGRYRSLEAPSARRKGGATRFAPPFLRLRRYLHKSIHFCPRGGRMGVRCPEEGSPIMAESGDMSVKQVAGMWGVAETTVCAWIRSGLLPARRLGRRYLIRREDALAVAGPVEPDRLPPPEVRQRTQAREAVEQLRRKGYRV